MPPGGDGVYYLSTSLLVYNGQMGIFDIRLNDKNVCAVLPDHDSNGDLDFVTGSCSVVVSVVAGNNVLFVLLQHLLTIEVSDDEPIIWDTALVNHGGDFNTVLGAYTAPANGLYQYVLGPKMSTTIT